MNLTKFQKLSREVSSLMADALPEAIQSSDDDYWCTSWRITNHYPRELYLEWRQLDGGYGIRAGLYFKDSKSISGKHRDAALETLLNQRDLLRRNKVVPTYTSHDSKVDHEPFGWSTPQLRLWLAGKSNHRDLVRSWGPKDDPAATTIVKILRPLVPIWRAWNELDRKPPLSKVAEGELRSIVIELRQRNTAIVRSAREYHGMDCVVCGFNFEEKYGEIGRGYIEVHHKKAIATGKTNTRLNDLCCVCANCHRMLHRRRKMLSPAALKRRLQNA